MWAGTRFRAVLLLTCALPFAAARPASEPESGLRPRQNVPCTLKSPTPKNLTCGARGFLKPTYDFPYGGVSNFTVPKLSTCREYCAARVGIPRSYYYKDGCAAFAFEPSSGNCALFFEPTFSIEKFHEDPSSPSEIYSIKCFSCSPQCPHPPETNIIDNGGFEDSGKLIGPWYISTKGEFEVVSPGHNSTRALKVSNRSFEIDQTLKICKNQKYSMSVDIMITKDDPKAKDVVIDLEIGAGQLTLRKSYNTSSNDELGSWHTFSGTTQATTFDRFSKHTYDVSSFFVNIVYDVTTDVIGQPPKKAHLSGYSFYVDNFVFQPIHQEFETVGPNLITNGGFESGSLEPWILNEQQHADYGPNEHRVARGGLTADSKYLFVFDVLEYEVPYADYEYFGIDDGGFFLQQNFTSVPGQLYLLTFNYKATHIDDVNVRIVNPEYGGYDGPGNVYWKVFGYAFNNYVQTQPGKLYTFSRVFQSFSNPSILKFDFQDAGFRDRQNMTVMIDNVSIAALADQQV